MYYNIIGAGQAVKVILTRTKTAPDFARRGRFFAPPTKKTLAKADNIY